MHEQDSAVFTRAPVVTDPNNEDSFGESYTYEQENLADSEDDHS